MTTRNGITKARMIPDAKESGVKWITAKTQRVILPRLLDAVLRVLFLLSCISSAMGWLLLRSSSTSATRSGISQVTTTSGSSSALPKEKSQFLVFLRAAQGSANAPLLWARLAAFVMRLTQALFDPSEVNLTCYVDDPIAALRGIEEQRKLNAAIIVLAWEALGLGLAYAKGQFADKVTWIGGTVTCESTGVRASVTEFIIMDIREDLQRILQQNITSVNELHSLIGKLGHAAGLLIIMRPFLGPLWAALYATDHTRAPRNKVWTKHISCTLRWFDAFVAGESSHIERFFRLDA